MRQISPAELLASQPDLLREEMAKLTPETKAKLLYKWRGWWARPNQLAPEGNWSTWMILAGRGFGKTRSGSEWIKEKEAAGVRRFALVAETAADARDVMVEGPSGIRNIYPKRLAPTYEPSKRRLTWPSGAVATLYNGTEPDQLRGPEHGAAWVDELAKYHYPQEMWDNLQFGLRMGDHPQTVVTTTPRPIPVIRGIISDPNTVITRGSTFENASNLAESFLATVKKKYEGTRLGRQELFAEILNDMPGALWTQETIDACRIEKIPSGVVLVRVVVAVDPSGVNGEEDSGDTVGIIVAGLGSDEHVYVLHDGSLKGAPTEWGRRAVQAYHTFAADRLVAENNYGGAMVEHVIRTVDPNVSYKAVSASRGKVLRAEPVAALYEQGRVHHVGAFPALEDQMTLFGPRGYIGAGSPDRLDAMVWATTDLALIDQFTYGMLDVL